MTVRTLMTVPTPGSCISRMMSLASMRAPGVTKIAREVLDNPEEAVSMNITDLAERVGTSASTVSRFCTRLGYDSYKAFQVDLGASLAANRSPISDYFGPTDDVPTITQRVFELNRHSLSGTLSLLDCSILDEVAKLVLSVKRVFISGVGSSGLIARLGALRFQSIGITTIPLADPFESVLMLSSANEDDVLICISHSGRSSHIVDMLGLAAELGVRTVGITNYADSPVADLSDRVLLTSYTERKVNAAVSSSAVAQVCVLDAIYFAAAHYQSAKAEELSERIERTAEKLLRSKRPRGEDG